MLTAVLPAHNEADNIGRSIAAAQEALEGLVVAGQLEDWEIVVVDDGSSDDTAHRIMALESSRVHLIQHVENQGYGAALRTGFRAAKGDLVFFTDADLQFDAAQIERLMAHIGDFDIVVGFRSARQDPWVRRANAWAWGRTLQGVFGLQVQDVNCAFKLFRRHVLDAISIESEGAFINAEILLKAMRLGFSMHQVPVSHFARTTGQQSGADARVVVRAFWEMARFYRRSFELEGVTDLGPWTSERRTDSVANTIR